MKHRSAFSKPASGFSLIEVMVALIIVSVGLLGIAKMQAIAYASTGIASKRSLAAIQASSLASSMSANRAYWASGLAPAVIQVNGLAIASADPALSAPTNCVNVACTPSQIAGYDLQTWVAGIRPLLFNDQVTITCSKGVIPVNCVITMTWTENDVGLNPQEAAAAQAAIVAGTPPALQLPSYTLYVQP
jgi:type IV pilus assembly protein PilV